MTVDTLRVGPVALAWEVAPTDDEAAVHRAAACLPASQARRAAGLSGARAATFVTGRRLLVRLAADLEPGAALEIDTGCTTCGEDHGRPRAVGAPLALSVAYAGPLVVAAAARREEVGAVGVDVERESGAVDLSGLAPAGASGLVGWTRIEAVLKADGRGIRLDPGEVRIDPTAPGPLLRQATARLPGRDKGIEVATVTGPAAHLLSVAVIAARG
ncbi:hypothetical protein ABC304_03310 [Microbacterium sp. 1P10UB]|uniref:4'-phosphopantetheinyl transferase family protein n=1 Tax=unclassified Microbacterium TaxID=2609290 RepID=UPI0039A3F041